MALLGPRPSWFTPKAALCAGSGLVLLLGAIQFIPYGRDHTQAPEPSPFHWRAPGAQALARAACYDCHSNQTRWWWAVKVAPLSWLAQSDIDEAKSHVNFSAWDGRLNASGLQRALNRGMPPLQYTLAHPEARLSAGQKQELVRGFQASLGGGAESASPAGPVLPSSQGSDKATAVINADCSSCHSPKRALAFHTSSPARAKALVDRMIHHGAKVSASAETLLVSHFTS